MFWILSLVASGAIFLFVNRFGLALLGIGATAVLLYFVVLAALWLDDISGVNHVLVSSWQFLSGVESPADILAFDDAKQYQCLGVHQSFGTGLLGMFLLIVILLAAFGNIFLGLIAIIGIPAGAIMSGYGALTALLTWDDEVLKKGLRVFTSGLGAMVAAGLVMRIIHIISLSTLMC